MELNKKTNLIISIILLVIFSIALDILSSNDKSNLVPSITKTNSQSQNHSTKK